MQELHATITDGFHLMAAESVPVRGGFHYQAWVRRGKYGPFRGGQGFTLQEAVDQAIAHLRDTPAGPLAGLKLNLTSLLKGEQE